jgi:hypothetical protein
MDYVCIHPLAMVGCFQVTAYGAQQSKNNTLIKISMFK